MKLNKIVENKYIDALLKLMLLSAGIHMIILIIFAVIEKSILVLNYFNILDLDLIFPNIINGWVSQAISVLIISVTYITFLHKR